LGEREENAPGGETVREKSIPFQIGISPKESMFYEEGCEERGQGALGGADFRKRGPRFTPEEENSYLHIKKNASVSGKRGDVQAERRTL